MQPRSLRVRGAHDLDLHVLEWSREGVPLVLLHGHGNEAHLWDDFAPCVAPHYRVLAVDQRGHGDSDWDPEGRYDADAMTDDLERLTEALGIERFVLVGFSMGGRVAMTFAGRHPDRLAGLALVDIGPELDLRGILRIQGEIAEQREPVFDSIEEYARLLSLHYPAGRPEALMRMARHGLRQREDGRFVLKMDPALRADRPMDEASRAAEEVRTESFWKALAALPCPTLVVRGAASDILSADVADRMVEEVLPNGQLAVIPQAAHSVATDNPEAFGRAVSEFVLG